MKKKIAVLLGVIIVVAGIVLYNQSSVIEDQAAIARVMSSPDPDSPLYAMHLEANALLGKFKAMRSGAIACWGIGGTVLAIGYLMRSSRKPKFLSL